MPEVWREFGFSISYYTNENDEWIHFHVKRGGRKLAKYFLLSNGTFLLDTTKKCYLTKQEQKKILSLQYNNMFKQRLIAMWNISFGNVMFKG